MEETEVKKIKITATRIKNTLFNSNKQLIKLKKDRVKLNQLQQTKGKISSKETALEKNSIKSSLKNIGQKILSGPRSLIDKFKEFFGLILLGILVNNLPKIVQKLQEVFGKIKSFLDNNPWIMDAVKFGFKIIGDGIMALAKLIKDIKPFIGGSFEFALKTIRSTKNQIGELVKTFDDLEKTALGMFSVFGVDSETEKQAKADLEGKYYSNTTKKTYSSYKDALKDPAVKAAARNAAKRQASQKAQKAKTIPTASGGSYNPSTGYTYNPNFRDITKATGVLAPRRGVMGTMIPGQQDTWRRYGPGEDPNVFKQNVERYNLAKYAKKFARGGTAPGVINPQKLSSLQSGTSYSTQSGTKAGSALSRKAIESISSFGLFEKNIKDETRNVEKQEKNYGLFGEFLVSYKILENLRKENKEGASPRDPLEEEPPITPGEILEYDVSGGILPSTFPGRGSGPRGSTGHGYKARDYEIESGKAITVFKPGTVTFAEQSGNYGNTVIIDHGDGMETLYAHLSKINVNVGDTISEGEKKVIGLTGGIKGAPGAGNSDGPHLHFEVMRNGSQITGYNDGDAYFRFGTVTGVKKRSLQQLNNLINKNLVPTGKKLTGEISWYGPGFYGNKTASGKPFTKTSYVAAHRTLPFGTILRITWNGRTITVPVEDRGPYAEGSTEGNLKPHPSRTIDLSEAAAKDLGMIQSGVVNGATIDIMKVDTSKNAIPIETKISAEQLRRSITGLMGDLGTTKKIFGQQNLSVEIKDGKLEIKDAKGGLFGTGLLQSNYDIEGGNVNLLKEIENYLKYELNKRNEEKNKPGPNALDYGGAQSNSDMTILKETVIAMVPGPVQPVPFPVDRIVPIPVSSGSGENINFLLG